MIYCCHNEIKPILLLQIYAKADQENLTAKQEMSLWMQKTPECVLQSAAIAGTRICWITRCLCCHPKGYKSQICLA